MRIALGIILLVVVPQLARSRQIPANVTVRIVALDTVCYPNCSHPTEWKATLVAELFDSAGGAFAPDSAMFFEWGADFCGGGGFGWGFASGSALWTIDVDGNKLKNTPGCCPPCVYQSYLIGVRVTRGPWTVVSGLVRVPDGGTEWMASELIAGPNPFDLSKSDALVLSVPTTETMAQVSILSVSGDLLFRREYGVTEYFGRRLIHMPATDFSHAVRSGISFVVVTTSRDHFTLKIAFIGR